MGRNPFAGASSPRLPSSVGPPTTIARTGLQTDLATLAETIAQATSIIQAAGLTQGSISIISLLTISGTAKIARVKEPTSKLRSVFVMM
jgi:hypothetical protein